MPVNLTKDQFQKYLNKKGRKLQDLVRCSPVLERGVVRGIPTLRKADRRGYNAEQKCLAYLSAVAWGDGCDIRAVKGADFCITKRIDPLGRDLLTLVWRNHKGVVYHDFYSWEPSALADQCRMIGIGA